METFDSIAALKKEILKRMRVAIEYAEDDVRLVLATYNDKFYEEYEPVEYYIDRYGIERPGYERTYQLHDSIYDTFDESNIVPIGNRGYFTTVAYNGNWEYKEDPEERGWNTEDVVRANMYGHPQHAGGTAVWADPRKDLIDDGGLHEILKNALNKAGLPVK